MKINLRQALSLDCLSLQEYAVTFCGNEIDHRGKTARECLARRSNVVHTLTYYSRLKTLSLNNSPVSFSDLENIFTEVADSPIALETTTLGFVEVLFCCRAAFGRRALMDCIYIEPGEYRRSPDSHLLSKRDFELSGEIVGFIGIPGASRMLRDRVEQKSVFFVGYEGSRFRRAFTELEILKGRNSSVVFGIPAFNPGWENDSQANIVPIMQDLNINSTHFCGANNPRAAYDLLSTFRSGLQSTEKLFIAPLGTKPHGLASALFVAQDRNVGIIYDHPNRTTNRSKALGQCHLFSIENFH